MRIDDEKKVVWCSEWLVNRLKTANFVKKTCLGKIKILSEYTLSGHVPETDDDEEWVRVIKAIFEGYTFKLEQPKKYYWRKKKEYLAWFEDTEENYMNVYFSEIYLDVLGDSDNCEFTEQEARHLLKDDFDKFEKVECE